ncbi:hypothetical protein Tco_1287910, partial [Tanacetum coccineum]
MRLDVPNFTEEDPEKWLFAIAEYFSLLNTLADQRLRIRCKESVMDHFGPSKYEDPQGALSKLLQLVNVEEYQDSKGDVVESSDISTLNSLIGQGGPRSLQLRGMIGSDTVHWRERFMNYLEEQTDGEAMINSIQNGDHPLPVVTQVSLARTTSNVTPPLKDKSINNSAKELWDALERHMLGSEYCEHDRKAAVLYEYDTFKAIKGELFLDTYIRYLHLKKCEWKQYGTMIRQNKNLMDINIDALYNILKQNQGDMNEAMRHKKKAVVVTSDPLALAAEKTKVSKHREKSEVQSESEG